jgi:hypothetical protein
MRAEARLPAHYETRFGAHLPSTADSVALVSREGVAARILPRPTRSAAAKCRQGYVRLMRPAGLLVAVLLIASCGGDGDGLREGATVETDYGRAVIGPDDRIHFEDCTDEMRDAGGGRLVDFDPVRDAGVEKPSNDGEWVFTCGGGSMSRPGSSRSDRRTRRRAGIRRTLPRRMTDERNRTRVRTEAKAAPRVASALAPCGLVHDLRLRSAPRRRRADPRGVARRTDGKRHALGL